jgi:hypothetical protein
MAEPTSRCVLPGSVSVDTSFELLASGDLRSVKIDRTRLVRGSDLRAYVESLGPVA